MGFNFVSSTVTVKLVSTLYKHGYSEILNVTLIWVPSKTCDKSLSNFTVKMNNEFTDIANWIAVPYRWKILKFTSFITNCSLTK